jgi:hypothetical protein
MVALAPSQAAGEYVGTLLRGIPASLDAGARMVSGFVADHPVLALGSLLAVLMLWALFSGGGRRRG